MLEKHLFSVGLSSFNCFFKVFLYFTLKGVRSKDEGDGYSILSEQMEKEQGRSEVPRHAFMLCFNKQFASASWLLNLDKFQALSRTKVINLESV